MEPTRYGSAPQAKTTCKPSPNGMTGTPTSSVGRSDEPRQQVNAAQPSFPF